MIWTGFNLSMYVKLKKKKNLFKRDQVSLTRYDQNNLFHEINILIEDKSIFLYFDEKWNALKAKINKIEVQKLFDLLMF